MPGRPISSRPGGILGVSDGVNSFRAIGQDIVITSSDGSVDVTADANTKTVDIKLKTGDALDCNADVAVGDLVYSDAGVLKKAKADSITTMPAIGLVSSKPTSTTCKIETSFIEEGTGFNGNEKYYVSAVTAGELSTALPASTGNVIQHIGIGIDTTKRIISVIPSNIVIRS